MSDIILEARAINKDFHDPVTVRVLTDISFSDKKKRICFGDRQIRLR